MVSPHRNMQEEEKNIFGQPIKSRHEDDEFLDHVSMHSHQNSQPVRKNPFEPNKSYVSKKHSPKMKSAQPNTEYRMLTRRQKKI